MRHREQEEPSDWYGAIVLESVPDEMLFTCRDPVLDKREREHLARLVRGMTGDVGLTT